MGGGVNVGEVAFYGQSKINRKSVYAASLSIVLFDTSASITFAACESIPRYAPISVLFLTTAIGTGLRLSSAISWNIVADE